MAYFVWVGWCPQPYLNTFSPICSILISLYVQASHLHLQEVRLAKCDQEEEGRYWYSEVEYGGVSLSCKTILNILGSIMKNNWAKLKNLHCCRQNKRLTLFSLFYKNFSHLLSFAWYKTFNLLKLINPLKLLNLLKLIKISETDETTEATEMLYC